MFQMKKLNKTPEEELSKHETGNLPQKQFRKTVIKMVKRLRRRMDAQNEKPEVFNGVRKYKEKPNGDEK